MAPTLRKAGVTSVDVHGLAFNIGPAALDKVDKNEHQQASLRRQSGNPLDDFATFGGRSIPGFKRLRDEDWGDS